MTARGSTVVVLGLVSCITWQRFSELSCVVFTKYLGMKSILKGQNGLFHAYFLLSREICQQCYAELDLCLYLTGTSYYLS